MWVNDHFHWNVSKKKNTGSKTHTLSWESARQVLTNDQYVFHVIVYENHCNFFCKPISIKHNSCSSKGRPNVSMFQMIIFTLQHMFQIYVLILHLQIFRTFWSFVKMSGYRCFALLFTFFDQLFWKFRFLVAQNDSLWCRNLGCLA